MKKLKGILVVGFVLVMVLVTPLSTLTVKASWVPQVDINNAIAAGLAYLNATQTQGGSNDGSWDPGYYQGVAATALSVLCFENNGHLPDGDPVADPYVDVVRRGLDYLLSKLIKVVGVGPQTHGDPDTNGNGYAIYAPGRGGYETGMVIMALVASGNKNRVATPTWPGRTFIPEVDGHTYEEIVREMVDFAAWAQSDGGTGRGGWRYWAYNNYSGTSDNSVSPWFFLGLHSAELWGINAPAFVKTELEDYWLDYTQNDVNGGFGYTSWSSPYISATGGGIIGLDYCGVPASDDRVVNATAFLASQWGVTTGWGANFGNLYAMYNVMKGLRLAIPPISTVGTHDWYNEYADALLGNQSDDGHWDSWTTNWAGGVVLDTAFAILILQYVPVVVQYDLTVNVVDGITGDPVSGALVTAVGPTSTSDTTDGGKVVFTNLQAGDYTISASKAGYDPDSTSIFLSEDTEITLLLMPSEVPPPPVGGFEAPPNTLALLAPWILLALATSFGVVVAAKRKRKH